MYGKSILRKGFGREFTAMPQSFQWSTGGQADKY